MRNNLPERDGAGKSKFLARNYAGYFDEKLKKKRKILRFTYIKFGTKVISKKARKVVAFS